MQPFQLAPPLIESSVIIADLPLSCVLLKNQALFPWCVLVPKISNVTEIYQLSKAQLHQLIDEIALISQVMQTQFQAKKLNVGSLGNMVSQLHIHIVGRFEQDACWPQGIWQANIPTIPYEPAHLDLLTESLKNEIGNWLKKGDN
jgi:diadenosine tetraphosphate (Ap4A) HIT family hydrolase